MLIAKALNEVLFERVDLAHKDTVRDVATHIANHLASDNRAFDSVKFYAAVEADPLTASFKGERFR